MYNFKRVMADVSSDGEWLYMLDDEEGTVVDSCELVIEDEEDEEVARYYDWTDSEIEYIKMKKN